MQTPQPTAQQLLDAIQSAMQNGDNQQAAQACQAINQLYPQDPNGWYASSYVALQLGGPEHALRCIDQALMIRPGIAQWALQRARCLQASGEVAKAATEARNLADGKFGQDFNHAELGLLASSLAEYELALDQFRQAIALEPHNHRHLFNLATVQRFTGDLEGAAQSCDAALRINPLDYDALYLRSGLQRQSSDHNHVAELEAALPSTAGNPLAESLVFFALAKELEDMESHEPSFEALQQGASARRKTIQYDVAEDVEFIETIRSVYDHALITGGNAGHTGAVPIFVIGLPRTGTTLAERILGSHDEVISAGELTLFTRLIAERAQVASQAASTGNPAGPTRSDMVRMTAGIDFDELGQAYLQGASPRSSEAFFIDKFPQNSLNAGAIARALPDARIILLQRHPMDSCYSMYKQLFTDIYQFSYSLEELGRYFIAHQALMNHWTEVLGERLHVVRYEDLVNDTEATARKLLEYCGLPWQDQCLEFHRNRQASTTASASQVREAVYSSSVGKWRAYEKQLEPLRVMLDEAGLLDG
jgi:tetratricopeptide (TPR) repeat protein